MGPATPSRTTRHWPARLSVLACALAPAAFAAPPKPAGCLIEAEQVVDIGSPVTGIIDKLQVSLGDQVEAGQPVVLLRADVERASAQAATLRSQIDAEVRAAAANVDLAQQKVGRTRQLLAKDFVSQQALDQAQVEWEVAAQKLKLARSQQKIYAQEQAVAVAQLSQRTLRSPIRGIVVERFSNLGERVEDRPVLRVASIDPLRVSLMVPVAQYGQFKVGDSVSVRPELPGSAPLSATVQYVDKIVDAASNTFRVRLRLPNPDLRLPAGLRCKAELPVATARPPLPAAPTGAGIAPAPAPAPQATPAPRLRMSTALLHWPRPPALAAAQPASGPVPLKFSVALADVH